MAVTPLLHRVPGLETTIMKNYQMIWSTIPIRAHQLMPFVRGRFGVEVLTGT
jgi:hypothetical protein